MAGALPVWFLSKLTRQTATVAFSGEGADEMFAGYLTHRASELARLARRWPAPLLPSGSIGRCPAPCLGTTKSVSSTRSNVFSPAACFRLFAAILSGMEPFPTAKKTAWCSIACPPLSTGYLLTSRLPIHAFASLLHFDQTFFLPDDILMKVDRMSMAPTRSRFDRLFSITALSSSRLPFPHTSKSRAPVRK